MDSQPREPAFESRSGWGSPCEYELLTLILAQNKDKPRYELEH